MKHKKIDQVPTGDQMLKMLEALANPHRMRIIASLTHERSYVSELARMLQMSRPLLYMHLQRLESAGLITSSLELSSDGKAMKYVEVSPFFLQLSPELITEAVETLTTKAPNNSGKKRK
ncbi:transcriptional regulator, ArsR family [Seinonella peptonophila]|uniref:Transcriptional regulator, ArsR family n=1 Tax=Seinonella peptonophila TaxID=112248 RepID=A0A1M4X679_9BACL|nr:winged helix-turn-helix domain-containing protein [Seinonella peptonophila]SHE88947.1 transcriptional regulator, ArsR family [Seinonella peptonophila]